MKEQISLASPGSSSHSQVSEIKTGPESHRKNEEVDTRFKLMKKAFAHTAAYDTAIAGFFTKTPWAEVDGTYTQH